MSRNKKKQKTRRGFTLIELLVTVSIFVIVSVIVLANYPAFNSRIVLDNLAHDIALSVREAQVFGTSIKEFGIGSGVFPSHGVYFDTAANKEFVLFADTDRDTYYDTGTELVERFSIQKGNTVSALCGFTSPVAACNAVSKLHITFIRPNPEATIRDGSGAIYAYASITARSPRGDTRTVEVWSNGQIAVQ
ncbi:MAG: type II secretion system protein [Parcubacteria group bacterium]|nr:type II secretion system protein [Parcubacteria group bacterium]